MLDDGQLGRPVSAKALAVHTNARFIHFRTGLQVVNHAGKHALRSFAGLDGRLSGSRRVNADESNAIRQNGAEIFRQVFFAAVEAADGDNYRYRALAIFWQAQVAHDFRTFEWNVHYFERTFLQPRVR